jgi:hypothetical protein
VFFAYCLVNLKARIPQFIAGFLVMTVFLVVCSFLLKGTLKEQPMITVSDVQSIYSPVYQMPLESYVYQNSSFLNESWFNTQNVSLTTPPFTFIPAQNMSETKIALQEWAYQMQNYSNHTGFVP